MFLWVSLALFVFLVDNIPHSLTAGALKADTDSKRSECGKEMGLTESKPTRSNPHAHTQSCSLPPVSKDVGALVTVQHVDLVKPKRGLAGLVGFQINYKTWSDDKTLFL